MNDKEIWLAIALLTVATLIARCSLWLVGQHITLSKRLQNALRYAPACALTAIIVPDLLLADGHLQFSLGNHKLIASLVALGFYLFKRNMLQTILVGMLCFTFLRLGIL